MKPDKKSDIIQAKRILTEYMEANHLRKTPERYAILEAVYNYDGLFDCDELYKMMDKIRFRVSRGTVYNTMELLSKTGLVNKLMIDNVVKYEKDNSQHSHFYQVCTECGKTIGFYDEQTLRCLQEVNLKRFHPSVYSISVYGICSTCLSKLRRKSNMLEKKKRLEAQKKKTVVPPEETTKPRKNKYRHEKD